jgi:hypothetical protein
MKPAETVTITVRLVWMTLTMWALMWVTGIALFLAVVGFRHDVSDLKTQIKTNASNRVLFQDQQRSFDCFEYRLDNPDPIYLCKDIPDPSDVTLP